MSKSSPAPNYFRAAHAALDVRPITPAIGAEIHGIRLSGDLPAETVTAIRDALLRHRVVFSLVLGPPGQSWRRHSEEIRKTIEIMWSLVTLSVPLHAGSR